ncbi:GroES-like protein [Aspergillus ruber CBS 135680]|uniref:GroES-like protein n=1 Tax=Aspergillus ruber (strain CBS 135680) TaxID=1388766 RepID=A0A017RZJ1_ASPRC|nr:GroES-like protein [Aspergillus ruber CBS 135680]EYE90062.1 GroES-like protein [Aspergillus ruber CBS 135680]
MGSSCDNVDIKLGDRVGIRWIAFTCGSCAPCMAGADKICQKGQKSGNSRPGIFQEYALDPALYMAPIPDGLSSDIAAPLLRSGVTAYSALKKSRAQSGD